MLTPASHIRRPPSTLRARRWVARKTLLLRYAGQCKKHPFALRLWVNWQRSGITPALRRFLGCAFLGSSPGACGGQSTLASCRRSRKSCVWHCDAAPIHEGPWGSETSAKRLPRGCLNLAAALRPTLPLTPKGPSSGVDAPCGDFEDNKGLSGPTGKKHK